MEIINNLIAQTDWSNPWSWVIAGLLIGIITLHIIPKVYKEALSVFFVAKYSSKYSNKYSSYYQQTIAYQLATKHLEAEAIKKENNILTANQTK